MNRPQPEPMQAVKQRRDAALKALVDAVPYARVLGITFERRGDELSSTLHYQDSNIGNPLDPSFAWGCDCRIP